MGMAASQARFLGLTARLNNVEFEAQQIHQQRTALSNKSASYYTDLLGLGVPTAPSVDAYTQTIYTFDDGALTNQITAMVATGNGEYKVSYLKTWEDDFSIVSAAPRIITHDGANYRIGNTLLRELGSFNVDASNSILFETDSSLQLDLKDGKFYIHNTTTVYTGPLDEIKKAYKTGMFAEGYYADLSIDELYKLSGMEADYAKLLAQDVGAGGSYVRYVQNTTTNEWEPTFYMINDVTGANYDNNDNSLDSINAYTIGKKTRNQEIIGVEHCEFEQDSTGRYMSITIPDGTGGSRTYSLTINTITDQDAYDDAMNQYEYAKAEYDHSIAEINAKIEIIQAEDKDLELRLKQLDTEHNAIQTERDQVKDMIKKNVDSSFKTFG